jgi:protocatechuate 3,4-dioxygenase beta subunit
MKKIVIIALAIVIAVGLFFVSRDVASWRQTPETSSNTTEETAQQNTDPINCTKQPIPELTEGPYYTANSPEKKKLYEEDVQGEKVTVTGYVLDLDCKPIANAWIDFWQADGDGNYDNEGYTLRGHQYTDQSGKYTLETVIPGEYPGRTPHIHFKIQASETAPIITSQLYLPDAERNATDAIFDERLVMDIQDTPSGKVATYNIVVVRE